MRAMLDLAIKDSLFICCAVTRSAIVALLAGSRLDPLAWVLAIVCAGLSEAGSIA